ncbi:RND family efflux transporter, MFP subunit [Nitrosospira multiformis ATCC 25196]|uniref:RND family efflux transporter, MFP subunit n=1 Tax=Nitrosospira multiformis (strain ATCC 25196 / NCIMB 11849 / C 71) TaxID=323848 RepID=Q2YAJ5_NITMU|nr:efflux RND transporter periplasmic adaptor subunit [Nitrosospira multiformis]ABB74226.1 Secretion protein HlyD [Nitrosospira multiformis ATCC 25196]SEF48073.1 RND family efflux transporter, MFP subunit [Nitrosospira multiformis ATCC 25196]
MTINVRRFWAQVTFACVSSWGAAFGWAGEFDCLIEARQIVEIRPSTTGIIEKIWVDRGDAVNTGQILVTLDSGLEKATTELAKYRSTMEGAIQASQSRSEYATLKHHRREQLLAQKFVSTQDRDEAETEKRLAEAELKEALDNKRVAQLEYRRASEQLRLRTVRSPFNGIVVDRMMHPGELTDARSDNRKIILKIADITVLHVETLLPLEAYGKVKPGQLLEVFPEAPVGGSYKARVKIVDKVMDTASGTFGVRMEIANDDSKLPAGIKCRVSVPGVNTRVMHQTVHRRASGESIRSSNYSLTSRNEKSGD